MAYASRHWAYPPPITDISVNTAVARAVPARAKPTTEFVAPARAVVGVAPRTTFVDAARAFVALRDTVVGDTTWRTVVPLRPVTTFDAPAWDTAERETTVLGRAVALRDTVARPDEFVFARVDVAAVFVRVDVVVATPPAVPPRVTAVPPRGFGAWAPYAPNVTNVMAKHNEYLQKLTIRIVKIYISLLHILSFLRILNQHKIFILCNNLPHFLPNHPNDAPQIWIP